MSTDTTDPKQASSATATIEVLTAEVRVLMVGRRQVTLSVYRQLDRVPFDKIEPFGRVRDRDTTYGIAIVGRAKDGILVRATVEPADHTLLTAHPLEWEHWCFHQARNDSGYALTQSGHRKSFKITERKPWSVVWEARPDRSSCKRDRTEWDYEKNCNVKLYCDVSDETLRTDYIADAEQSLDWFLEATAEYDKAKALPLIVLAGLR